MTERERHRVTESLRERKSFYYFNQWQFFFFFFALSYSIVANQLKNITIAPPLELVFCV